MPEDRNLRGQLLRHYDTAGLLTHDGRGYALTGAPLQQMRRLLPVEDESDWPVSQNEEAWQSRLEQGTWTTVWQYDALNQPLQQTDARGNRHHTRYDVAGRLRSRALQPVGEAIAPVLISLRYSAAGQKQQEVAGNSVITEYRYQPGTQRLSDIITTRPDRGVLQHLRYTYDPVGNITLLTDDAVATRYFRGGRTDGRRTFMYDSLYQLIQASGREQADAADGTDSPQPGPAGDTQYVPYTRRYDYDAGGNLTTLQHQGATTFTRTMVVSPDSNHALRGGTGLTPEAVRQHFDACGNQQSLETGQRLQWSGLNQLKCAVMLMRSSGMNDQEHYQYGGDGMRVRKCTQYLTGSLLRRAEVIYLPGLELRREGPAGGGVTEALEILCAGQSGRCQVRLLHWTAGRSGEQPAAIQP